MLNVSVESVGMSYVIPAAECELGLTSEHKGLINAAAFLGKFAERKRKRKKKNLPFDACFTLYPAYSRI